MQPTNKYKRNDAGLYNLALSHLCENSKKKNMFYQLTALLAVNLNF